MTGHAAPRTDGPCIGEPVSWLRLERYWLRELATPEASAVEDHLAACPACAAFAAEAAMPLTFSLPDSVTRPPGGRPRGRASDRSWLRGWRAGLSVAGGVAAALTIALLVETRVAPGPRSRLGEGELDSGETLRGSKGGDLAIELVRERGGAIEHGARTFRPGDRWKVLVTCPAERVLFWDLAVREAGRSTFPLSPSAPIACGNRVALPGAFALTGAESKRLCVVLGGDPVDHGHLGSGPPPAAGAGSVAGREVCVMVRPEGPGRDGDPAAP